MTHSKELSFTASIRSLVLLALVASAPLVSAQTTQIGARHSNLTAEQICIPGRPQAECKSFFVIDAALLFRVVNSRSSDSIVLHNGRKLSGDDFGFLGAVQAEVGPMYNYSAGSAVGVTLAGVMEEFRSRIGGKVRFRFWESRRLSIDVGLGAFVPVGESEFVATLNRRDWFVGTFALSQRDTWQFIFQAESHIQDFPEGRRTSVLYSGVQFREWPGTTPAIAVIVSTIVIGAMAL
jgi:hypothetical protein